MLNVVPIYIKKSVGKWIAVHFKKHWLSIDRAQNQLAYQSRKDCAQPNVRAGMAKSV